MSSILVIDDDEPVLKVTIEMLRSAGYAAFVAIDGRQVEMDFHAVPFDLPDLVAATTDLPGTAGAR